MRMLLAKALAIIGFLLLLLLGAVGIYGIYEDFTAGPPAAGPGFLPSRLPGVFTLMLLSFFLYPPATLALVLSFLLSRGESSPLLRNVYLASSALHIVWPLSILSAILTGGSLRLEPILVGLLALLPMALLYWFSAKR
ncbi:MAG: hypothetical protein NZ902_05055 [Acidilobaceae archaeon]|nr:hypothetical protein [Acidilobaceae archaeon]MCX8165935.1 hypothetical protein [Acidilobaceae archaeon]MDW7974578.1 hypothetical protein [Sulfolobales archaeon]